MSQMGGTGNASPAKGARNLRLIGSEGFAGGAEGIVKIQIESLRTLIFILS
jgi:hypothetical protein